MKSFLFFSLIFISASAMLFSQNECSKVMDEKSQTEILIGTCLRDDLLTVDFAGDYYAEYDAYIVDTNTNANFKNYLDGITITIVLGTWCGDSKEQVPRFLKMLDPFLRNDLIEINFICVDRSKTAPLIDMSGWNIEKVPTFIFYQDSKEIGRIIETPVVTLEKDMLDIIRPK